MKSRRWVVGAVAVAGVVALVAPAAGQGKTPPAALEWSASPGAATITSYDFGNVDAGSSGSKGFRLGDSSLTRSGKLVISVTGSSAFSITTDHCKRKSIGPNTSCWVGVGYAPPFGASGSDSAILTATDGHGATASLGLSGSSSVGPPGHVYWVNYVDGTVNEAPRAGGSVTTLASGQEHPVSVAVDGTNVYWVNQGDGTNGTVNQMPLGGGAVTTLAGGQTYPVSIAVDSTHVYWVDGAMKNGDTASGTVNEVPLGGGSVTTLASGQDTPDSLAVDGTNAYWIDAGYGGRTINEVPLGGGSVTTLPTSDPTDSHSPVALAVDGTHVYWIGGDGTVNDVPVGGGSVTTLAGAGHNHLPVRAAISLAVDGTHVYWLNQSLQGLGPSDPGTLYEVPVGGGSATKLVGNIAPSGGLAVDGTHLYWFDSEGVEKTRLGGGRVTTIASDQADPDSLALGP